MRETFYILQEVQQRGLTLSLEMIGFVRKQWRIQGRSRGTRLPPIFLDQTDARWAEKIHFGTPPPPPRPLSTGQKQVNMAIKTNYGRQRVIQTVVNNAHKSL